MKKINVNHYVKVRLTDHGRQIVKNHRANQLAAIHQVKPDFQFFRPLMEPDQDGFSSEQLWEIMVIFGPHIAMGSPACFEDGCIYIAEEHLEDHKTEKA